MVEVLVWLLVSVSYPSSSAGIGVLTVVERFKTSEQCEHVNKNLPIKHNLSTRCIQANILVPK